MAQTKVAILPQANNEAGSAARDLSARPGMICKRKKT
jgi:hypothetical protein